MFALTGLFPAAALQVTDDLQRSVTLEQAAHRIVSLAPHLTELAYSAGAGDKLVGVSRHCDHPPAVTQLPKISDHTTINYELVTGLKPDLILVWAAGLRSTALRKLTTLYDNVYVSDPKSFADIAENVIEIGVLAGNEKPARQAADHFLREISALGTRYARQAPVKTLYLVWRTPLMTVGNSHWISRAIHICGGVNIIDDAHADVVTLNRESVQLIPIDMVLHNLRDHASDPSALARSLDLNVPIFHVEDTLLHRPSLRLPLGIAPMCRLIHQIP